MRSQVVLLVGIFFCIFYSVAHAQVEKGVCVPPPAGIRHWWPGDGNGMDMSGEKHMDPRNGAGFVDGFVGKAMSFDGVNDYYKSDDKDGFDNYTVEAWVYVKYRSELPDRDWKYNNGVFGHMEPNKVHSLLVEFGRSAGWAGLWDRSGQWAAGAGSFNDRWVHISATRVREQVKKVYINGVEVGSSPASHYNSYRHPMYIGHAGHNKYFYGYIDELSYYDRVLSDSEIQSIYNAGTAGKCKTPDGQPPGPADTTPPIITFQSTDYDAGSATLSGYIELNEVGSAQVRVSHASTGEQLQQSNNLTSTESPYQAPFSMALDPKALPSIVRIDISAEDVAGNQTSGFAYLIETDFDNSGSVGAGTMSEPTTGVTTGLSDKDQVYLATADQGRPTLLFTDSSALDASFILDEQQALSLCGLNDRCVITVNGVPVETQSIVLPDGRIEFRTTIPDSRSETRVQLVFDNTAGASGVSLAYDFNTGNQVDVVGDAAQITLDQLGNITLTAGQQGGMMNLAFTLTAEQDQLRCAGVPNVCVVLENLQNEITTNREVLPDTRVRYSATVFLEPGIVNLYTLRVLDSEPPTVGLIQLSAGAIRSGDEVIFQLVAGDNTRIIEMICRHILPDGMVIEITPTLVPGSEDIWQWSFAPPAGAASGTVRVEVVITDLGGNTISVFPNSADGSELILDNDVPQISLPAEPITAPRFVNGTAVIQPSECVQLNGLITDIHTSVNEVTFEVLTHDGSVVSIPATPLGGGLYSSEYCFTQSGQAGGQHNVRIIASDAVGNTIIVNCDPFVLNHPPVVDAGEDTNSTVGSLVEFIGSFIDPDPNDSHTVVWEFGVVGGSSDQLLTSYTYDQLGIYTATLTVTDSWGASGSDTRLIYVLGNGTPGDLRGTGFWKHQYRLTVNGQGNGNAGGNGNGNGGGNGNSQHVDEDTLLSYQHVINTTSAVFSEIVSLNTLSDGLSIIDLQQASIRERATQHYLANWLNFAHGAIFYTDLVDVNDDGVDDMSFREAMDTVEAILLNASATAAELSLAKTISESVNDS